MKLSPEDDASRDLDERFVDGREAFEPDVQPCEGVRDDPAGLAEATAVRLAAKGDLRGDAGSVHWLAIFVVIVATIGLYDDGL